MKRRHGIGRSKNKIYDFFSYFEKQGQETMVHWQEITPPPSPTHVASPTSQGNSIEGPRKMKNIQDLYDET